MKAVLDGADMGFADVVKTTVFLVNPRGRAAFAAIRSEATGAPLGREDGCNQGPRFFRQCRTAHHGPASIAESDFSNFLLEDKLEEEQDMFIGGCPARLRSASGSGHAAYRGIDGGYVHAKDQQSALPVGLVWRRDGFFLKCALLGK
jgi:hypothetical protein